MKIKKVRIKRRAVVIDYEANGEDHSVTSRDTPLPSFVKAVENLGTLILDILHLPTEYIHGLKPAGLTIVDKQDTELVCIVAQKELTDCNSPFNIATPLRFMGTPQEEGSYSPPLTGAQVALVEEVLKEAHAYIDGHRAQGQLPLETPESEAAAESDGSTEDKGGEDAAPQLPLDEPRPKRKRAKKNAEVIPISQQA